MPDSQKVASMTVPELRKFARENGILLTSLTTKAAILQRIQETLASREQNEENKNKKNLDPSVSSASQPKDEPQRRATIIADEGDDASSGTSPARPKPVISGDSNKTSTGKNKPVFTLQGSRAWHNPRPFAQTQPPPGRYAPQSGQTISTLPRDGSLEDNSAYAAPKPRTWQNRTVSRFGPNAVSSSPSQQSQARAAERRTYQPPVRQPMSQSSAFRSVLPEAEAHYQADVDLDLETDIPEPSFPMELPPPTVETRAATLLPDMLAMGDCGDGAGILEIQPDGYGFLRAGNLLPGRNDVYISGAQIRRFKLRNGDYIVGKTRPQRENDRYAAMLYITSVNGEETQSGAKLGVSASELPKRRNFDDLTPTYPNRILRLSSREDNDLVLRVIDLFVPIGFVQSL
jgi:transcription termination factor Rho